MPDNIPDGITAQHIEAAIRDLDSGASHKFSDSTGYDVLFNGRRYPPKAVVGLAAEKCVGRGFGPYDFKGGLESKCFRVLEMNGFIVVPKNGSNNIDPEVDPIDDGWTEDELRAAVVAYIEMQQKERSGQGYTKKRYYRDLATLFGRTEKAFEYRMQNISYVMTLMGRSWLKGLKPAKNVGPNVAAQLEAIIAQVEGREVIPVAAFEVQARNNAKNKQLVRPAGNGNPKAKSATVTQYDRDPEVKAWVLKMANGICESCRSPAPFRNSDGAPFLEVHHVRQLADGGADTVNNAVAICPNCHREAHFGENSMSLIARLYQQVERLKEN